MLEAAGYIVFTGSGDDRRFLILRSSRRHATWGFPKGHVEPGEATRDAAHRELLEETGISDLEHVPGFEHVMEYDVAAGHHPVNREAYRKRVRLFLGAAPTSGWTRSPEHDDGGWHSADEVIARLTHDLTRRAFAAALEFLCDTAGDGILPAVRFDPRRSTIDMPHARVQELIRDVPDFPKAGIVFKDITPLLADAPAMDAVIGWMAEQAQELGVDLVAGPESRGFIFGTALAMRLGCGFVPIRKPGKLPWKTRAVSYDLEYGKDTVEIHEDAAGPGQRVLLVDDLLATGGTMAACCELVGGLGASVAGCLFLVELGFLDGRGKMGDPEIRSMVTY
ncbi:MAG: adenine phosphoribosyltransferase [Planctomycetes bacterium]|nr:adenine phosphoribosyltransferase [Planctomycetota bacterium]